MKGHGVCLGNAADSAEPQRHKEDAPSPAPGQLALFSSGREGEVEGHAAHEWQLADFKKTEKRHPIPTPSQGDVRIYFGWRMSAGALKFVLTLRPRYGGQRTAKRRFKQER